MTQTTISILLPTRGRKQACIKSITSLLSKANKPENIEILIGIDNDDQESEEKDTEDEVKEELTKSEYKIIEINEKLKQAMKDKNTKRINSLKTNLKYWLNKK